MKELEEFILCQCENIEHQMLFRTVEGDTDVYVSYHLRKLRWYERLWNGIKYIFGYTSIYGDFDEMILKPEDAPKLRKVVKWLESNHNPIK